VRIGTGGIERGIERFTEALGMSQVSLITNFVKENYRVVGNHF
jgi:hypothetical protein